jgi:basic membrane protein A and related proteins
MLSGHPKNTRFYTKYPIFIWITAILCIAVFAASFTGCSKNAQHPVQKKILNIGLILGAGGMGDKSFNDSAYNGLLAAQKELNIRFETVDYTGKDADIDALRVFAKDSYDLILGISFDNMKSIQTVANEFPNIRFGAIDFELTGNNVASVVYREQEGDFIMGALAAMVTRSKMVDVVGGTDIPAIRRIISGFTQGVAYQDSSVKVYSDIAGTFSDPQVGYNLAMSRYNQGVDVIHNGASKTGLGIIQAAQQVKKYTTGTSGDQRYLAPGYMIGNRPKRVDTAVQMLIEEVSNGTIKAGVRSLGLKENGLSMGPFDETVVTPAMMKRINEIRQKIISGAIQVKSE